MLATPQVEATPEERARHLFLRLDRDGNRRLSRHELEGAMQRHVNIIQSVIRSTIMRQASDGSAEAVANAAVEQVAAQVRQAPP